MTNPQIRLSVTAFFTSDKLGIDIAPNVSLTTAAYEEGGKFVADVGEKITKSDNIEVLIGSMIGKDLPAQLKADDWRPMTSEEIKEYLADNS